MAKSPQTKMLMMKLSGCLQAGKTEDKGKRICEVELISNQYFKSLPSVIRVISLMQQLNRNFTPMISVVTNKGK